ncbi:DNA polymerase I [Helicobacter suis HS5]|uniref:DNA polymerase I n=1 Tax=Helicobacter suis HS5 TaxID=710394 RepID=E7G4G0_9HELI|nr:DNA polymerase I [Helicobacter suis]EFX41653.1 DNA polymerase I [Helicobacter suis HS5]
MKTLHLVDTFGLLFKFYYPLRDLQTSKGINTAWLSAFAKIIHQLYSFKADRLIFALESQSNHRKTLDPAYKANRIAPPHLHTQLPIILEWIEQMGLCALSVEGYESDDVIASLCYAFKDHFVRIISFDKDFYQLVDSQVVLCDLSSRKESGVTECMQKYGIAPCQFRDYQGLVGDSSDGYKGVEGIGPKNASKLLEKHANLEALYANLDNLKLSPKLIEALRRDYNQAFLSRELATLNTSLFMNQDLSTKGLFPKSHPLLKIEAELKHYEMFGLLKQITPKVKPLAPQKINLCPPQEALEKISSAQGSVTQILELKEGLGLAVLLLNALDQEGEFFCISLNQESIQCLHSLSQHKLIAYNLKEVCSLLRGYNFPFPTCYEDIGILAWLENCYLEPSLHALGQYLGEQGYDLAGLEDTEALFKASINARLILKAYKHYKEVLSQELWGIAHKLEYPLLELLYTMQGHGFLLDIAYFKVLQQEFKENLENLEQSMQNMLSMPLNVNSSRQWAQVLYEHLGLESKGIKKGKIGLSTNEASLKALQATYAQSEVRGVCVGVLLTKLLNYREIFKLQSTYVEPFLKRHTQGKIHTTFYQNKTASSRLSSANPNLQNIPIRHDLGRKIARGFIASAGCVLIGVDYSQIELRLLAHFSEDQALLKAFEQKEDIHLNTATALFGNQAQAKRPIAKAINFGLIYGMGARKLAQTLQISQEEAKAYMERYFNKFPTIKNFLEELKARILQEGQVTTLLGHVRRFSFKQASPKLHADYLREGVNTLFQGSASDLVKLAMLAIYQKYESRADIKMLVQVHDELILEVSEIEARELQQEIKTLMENIYPLRVPLECHASIASNWADLKV